jgi:glycosyltransferase involved in cell wall biosynthesis
MMKTNEFMPLVSVLIPLYNQERYFKACMRSVSQQTYRNLEIIIVNDGSTDNSPQMARDWAACDDRVKVIDKHNEGLAYARRDGYLAAKGEYITFLDSDDMLTLHAIELMVNAIRESGVDLVVGMHDTFVGQITTNRRVFRNSSFPSKRIIEQPELFDKYFENYFRSSSFFPVNVWAKLYRKSVIDRAYQDTELYSLDFLFMGEDLFYNMKLFPYLKSMYRIDDSVYKYRYGGGTFGFNKNLPQVLLLCEKRLELLDKYDYSKGYEPLFAEYVAFVYNHASQLIYFKKADKDGVISFIKNEIEARALMPRLEAFYTQKKELSYGVRLLLNHDFESMYNYARDLGQTTFGSIKFKVVKFLVNAFSHLTW